MTDRDTEKGRAEKDGDRERRVSTVRFSDETSSIKATPMFLFLMLRNVRLIQHIAWLYMSTVLVQNSPAFQ